MQCYFGKSSKESFHFIEQKNTSQTTHRQASALQQKFLVFFNTIYFG